MDISMHKRGWVSKVTRFDAGGVMRMRRAFGGAGGPVLGIAVLFLAAGAAFPQVALVPKENQTARPAVRVQGATLALNPTTGAVQPKTVSAPQLPGCAGEFRLANGRSPTGRHELRAAGLRVKADGMDELRPELRLYDLSTSSRLDRFKVWPYAYWFAPDASYAVSWSPSGRFAAVTCQVGRHWNSLFLLAVAKDRITHRTKNLRGDYLEDSWLRAPLRKQTPNLEGQDYDYQDCNFENVRWSGEDLRVTWVLSTPLPKPGVKNFHCDAVPDRAVELLLSLHPQADGDLAVEVKSISPPREIKQP